MSIQMKADPLDAGCWIDSVWGQYAAAQLISLASRHGYDDWVVIDAALRILRSIGPNDDMTKSGDWELVEEMQDEVEEWMNEYVAPEGFSFEWFEGEFFLQANQEEE